MVMNMKTGKQVFKYYTYSIIWANKIIAEVKGYSIDKAYAISPLFGSMVEKQIKIYEEQFQQVRNFAVMCGAYNLMFNDFADFHRYLKADIEYFSEHKINVETQQMMRYYKELKSKINLSRFEKFDLSQIERDLNDPNIQELILLNQNIANRIGSLANKCVSITLDKLSYLPSNLRGGFEELKALGETIVKQVMYNTTTAAEDDYNLAYYLIPSDAEEASALGKYYQDVSDARNDALNQNMEDFSRQLQLLNKIREDLLND